MAENEIIRRVREKYGADLEYSTQFDGLVASIEKETGQKLSVNTLKRLFGVINSKVTPRRYTMDVIAQYIGYPNYELLLKDIGEESDISIFAPVETLEPENLEVGDQVQITYDPNRVILLTFTGGDNFLINEVSGSKNLLKGDTLRIAQMVVGQKMVAIDVIREGKSLGKYEAARNYGLTSIEVLV